MQNWNINNKKWTIKLQKAIHKVNRRLYFVIIYKYDVQERMVDYVIEQRRHSSYGPQEFVGTIVNKLMMSSLRK